MQPSPLLLRTLACLCGLVARVLATHPEVPGSIPGSTRFSEWQLAWNGAHSALVTINEELHGKKVSGSGLGNRN
jgi:hypothetical protein